MNLGAAETPPPLPIIIDWLIDYNIFFDGFLEDSASAPSDSAGLRGLDSAAKIE